MFTKSGSIARRDFLSAGAFGLAGAWLGLAPARALAAGQQNRTYVVVKPGTHPGIIFSEAELPALRERAKGGGVAGDAYRKVRETAYGAYTTDLTLKQLVGREGEQLADQLISMGLIYQTEGDRVLARKAVQLFQAIASGVDGREFYKTVNSDFFATEHWPKAFAFAWDWLYPAMADEERSTLLKGMEQWSAALYDHTESWWWRDAGYNCGAIPVGAQGLMLAAIQAESKHPDFQKWFSDCFRKVSRNYFPATWRANGICNEGPGYAHYHKNPTQFADAVRRTGGPDIIGESGAVNAMHYLRHNWMPQGRCGTVGDNTEYGRRVFQAIYLHGIRELGDQAGLWTWEKYADRARTEQFLQFLYYPEGLKPVSPGELNLPTSYYFEIDKNRAGYVFSRSEWDNEQAAWFAFTTRYATANHTHYDMNSFVFSAFGDELAAHTNVFGYSHPNHGADLEHNIIIVDEGGMPAADSPNSAGDDGSIYGYMTGVGTGRFADYVRGDARRSYADRSVKTDKPAVRADRAALFVKQGPNPYVVVTDDIQRDEREHAYHWQWYTRAKTVSGAGTFEQPFVLEGQNARCKIALLEPHAPEHDFRVVKAGEQRRIPNELGLLRVNVVGVQARFIAVGAAWRKDALEPAIRKGPKVTGVSGAASLVVEGENFRDLIVFQPGDSGQPLACGELKTDALMAVVRTGKNGKLIGYTVGDGTSLQFRGKVILQAPQRMSVSADEQSAFATGARQAREGLAPLPAEGSFWLPSQQAEVWADGSRISKPAMRRGMVSLKRT